MVNTWDVVVGTLRSQGSCLHRPRRRSRTVVVVESPRRTWRRWPGVVVVVVATSQVSQAAPVGMEAATSVHQRQTHLGGTVLHHAALY